MSSHQIQGSFRRGRLNRWTLQKPSKVNVFSFLSCKLLLQQPPLIWSKTLLWGKIMVGVVSMRWRLTFITAISSDFTALCIGYQVWWIDLLHSSSVYIWICILTQGAPLSSRTCVHAPEEYTECAQRGETHRWRLWNRWPQWSLFGFWGDKRDSD